MEPWNGTDNKHTGPQGEAGFDSCWPIKTTVKNTKKLQKSTSMDAV